MCVWKRRQHERRGELSTSAAPRWRWRTNSAAIQSVPCLVPEYLHHSSHARQALPRSPAAWRKHRASCQRRRRRPPHQLAKVARASRGPSSVTILRHGVFISPVWPTEGNRLVQCALTTTNCHLPASMAGNTYRRVLRKRAHQSSSTYTILPGQEPVLSQCPSRPVSLLQRRPSSR